MTKREPFANVRPGCLLSCHAWILVVDGKVVGQHNVKESLLFRAEQLNAAHEARVKEAVREAVKPLRDELRRLMDVVSEEDYGLLSDVLAETEPEAK